MLSLVARFAYLEMDPPPYEDYGTTWFDEGAYVHNARSQVLFGEWNLEGDLWKPMYISPTFNYISLLSFKTLGVNTFSMRIIPAFLGILTIIISSLLIMSRRFEEGALFFIIGSISPMLVMFSRIAMTEYLLLFFISIIIALMINNKSSSWLFIGFLAPFLFFSKMVTLFFIAAIPISLGLYYAMYRTEATLKKLKIFTIGGIISLGIWLLWLIPNFNQWITANFGGYGSRLGLGITKTGAALLKAFQFSLINSVIIALSILYTIYIIKRIRKKERIELIELFFIITLALFFFQMLFVDYALNRFVLLVPLLVLISAMFLARIQDSSFQINTTTLILKKDHILFTILFLYIIFSLTQSSLYFAPLSQNYDDAHTVIRNSQEIGRYIANETKVYGRYATALSLENKIQPYFSTYHMTFANTDKNMLPLFENKEINYAIIKENIFDQKEIEHYKGIEKSTVYNYIKDNFEIIKVIKGKNTRTNSQDDIYIYKRK